MNDAPVADRAGWRTLQHTADVGLEVWSPTFRSLLLGAARGMFALVADTSGVRDTVEREVKASGDDNEQLFVNWLSELNFLHQTHGELYGHFVIDELTGDRVLGHARGEQLNVSRHSVHTEIKGVTYHGLEVKEGPEGWRAKVVFDV